MTIKVLIGCETSGVVRDAFTTQGYDAWSCDLLPADTPTNRHIIGDVRSIICMDKWDLLMVAHPPCTRLCNSGVRWLHTPPPGRTKEEMWHELDEGAKLFSDLLNANIPHIAIENPVMHKYAKARIVNFYKFNQSIQPWQFGTDPMGQDNVKKRTCLWLKELPLLALTGSLTGATARADVHRAPPSANRWKIRSKFFPGVAEAMATQWGAHVLKSLLPRA